MGVGANVLGQRLAKNRSRGFTRGNTTPNQKGHTSTGQPMIRASFNHVQSKPRILLDLSPTVRFLPILIFNNIAVSGYITASTVKWHSPKFLTGKMW
eukprot:sb/3479059/